MDAKRVFYVHPMKDDTLGVYFQVIFVRLRSVNSDAINR